MDFVVSGIGAGLLPFLIGLSLSYQQNVNVLLILMVSLSLTLAHSSGHILQALGDYECDKKQVVQTFVVKYGRKRAILLMGVLSIVTGLSIFIYGALRLLAYQFVLVLFLPLPFCVPIVRQYIALIYKPTTQNAISLQKTTRRYGVIIMVLVVICLLAGKMFGL